MKSQNFLNKTDIYLNMEKDKIYHLNKLLKDQESAFIKIYEESAVVHYICNLFESRTPFAECMYNRKQRNENAHIRLCLQIITINLSHDTDQSFSLELSSSRNKIHHDFIFL